MVARARCRSSGTARRVRGRWSKDTNARCKLIGPNLLHIRVPDTDLTAKAVQMPRFTERLRPRAIRAFVGKTRAVITCLTCQDYHEAKHADDYSLRFIRPAQYSLLLALPKLRTRRTSRSAICKCCTLARFYSVHATTECRHQDRVIEKVFSLTDSNYLGEYLPVDAPTQMAVLGRIESW